MTFDAIVVGAGPAGAATATLLGRQGHRILLLERAAFPRPKTCGEGLMPGGRALLEELDLLPVPPADMHPFQEIRFHLPEELEIGLDFGELGQQGWITPRLILDDHLFRTASRTPGVTVRQTFQIESALIHDRGVEVSGWQNGARRHYRGRLLIGADGIRSRFHGPGIRRRGQRPRRFALSAPLAGYHGSGQRVEVHCNQGGEAYVAPLGSGTARVTLLVWGPLRCSRGRLADLYRRRLAAFAALREQFSKPVLEGPVVSTSPVSRRLDCCHARRLLLVGDAAGAVDPVTGQGITVALQDARLAARLLSRNLPEDRLREDDLAEYSRQRSSHFRPAFGLAQFLLFAIRRPWVARRARRALQVNPRLRQALLTLATTAGPPASLRRPDQLRLLLGL